MEHTLEKRVTFKYRDGWAREDAWEVLGTAKVVRSYDERIAEDEEGEAGTMMIVETTVTDPAVAEDDVRKALEHTFAGSSCTHDWDCCGCLHTTARARKWAGNNSWIVLQTHYRNY